MFDKNIPLPAPASKWDFATAEPGDSLSFPTKAEALKFAAAVRSYAGRSKKRWGTKMAEVPGEKREKVWRVWIADKEMLPALTADAAAIVRPAGIPSRPVQPLSTETDDDLGLSVDLRRGDNLTFSRLPEAQPVEGEEDTGTAPRRRNRPAPAVPKAADLGALLPQAAE